MPRKSKSRVEFHGRQVHHDYPARHAEAQRTMVYDDFADGTTRNRIRYGALNDRNPGGITYATREERIEARIRGRQEALARLTDDNVAGRAWVDKIWPHKEDPNDLITPNEEIRIDHRCSDCDVDVNEFHLVGCDQEVCPRCGGQAIGCGCE